MSCSNSMLQWSLATSTSELAKVRAESCFRRHRFRCRSNPTRTGKTSEENSLHIYISFRISSLPRLRDEINDSTDRFVPLDLSVSFFFSTCPTRDAGERKSHSQQRDKVPIHRVLVPAREYSLSIRARSNVVAHDELISRPKRIKWASEDFPSSRGEI